MRYTYTVHQQPRTHYPPYVERLGVFSREECAQIIAGGLEHVPSEATIGVERQTAPLIRQGPIRWLPFHEAQRWLWERLTTVCEEVNTLYGFDLVGFIDALQLCEYSGSAHYTWHTDCGPGPISLRKLSLSVQLSPPGSYIGGELEMHLGSWMSPASRLQ